MSYIQDSSSLILSLTAPQWNIISGEMSEKKMATTPCKLDLKLYICGKRIDVFNLQTLAYDLPLTFRLPEEDFLYRVAFCTDSELFIISRQYTFRVDIYQQNLRQEVHEKLVFDPTSQVVLREGVAIWVGRMRCVVTTIETPTQFHFIS